MLLAAVGAAAWVDGGSLENSAGVGRRTARRCWERCFFFLFDRVGRRTARRCWERCFFFLFDRGPAGAIFHWLAILPTLRLLRRAVSD